MLVPVLVIGAVIIAIFVAWYINKGDDEEGFQITDIFLYMFSPLTFTVKLIYKGVTKLFS
jgi:hypothetical protein